MTAAPTPAMVSTPAQGESRVVATEDRTREVHVRLSTGAGLQKHTAAKLLEECAPLTPTIVTAEAPPRHLVHGANGKLDQFTK